ncbi:hypothetical protein D3C76_1346180 [compost metagenome]
MLVAAEVQGLAGGEFNVVLRWLACAFEGEVDAEQGFQGFQDQSGVPVETPVGAFDLDVDWPRAGLEDEVEESESLNSEMFVLISSCNLNLKL